MTSSWRCFCNFTFCFIVSLIVPSAKPNVVSNCLKLLFNSSDSIPIPKTSVKSPSISKLTKDLSDFIAPLNASAIFETLSVPVKVFNYSLLSYF